MNPPIVSIVVVSWNTRELLRRCLHFVRLHTHVPHEIWVVDNGSQDGSAEMLALDFPDVRLMLNGENRGFAAANNQALPHARGRYVLLLNSDTEVQPEALDRMVAYMEVHPEAGALGCKLLNADRTLQPSAHNFYSTLGSLVENRLVALWWRRRSPHTRFLCYWDHGSARAVDWVTGACLMVRREVVDVVGELDERFFMYAEEIDWQVRMHQAGYAVHFTPDAEVVHLGGGSSREAPDRMRRQELHSRRLLMEKHYPPLTRWLFTVKGAMAIALWSLVARLRGKRLVLQGEVQGGAGGSGVK